MSHRKWNVTIDVSGFTDVTPRFKSKRVESACFQLEVSRSAKYLKGELYLSSASYGITVHSFFSPFYRVAYVEPSTRNKSFFRTYSQEESKEVKRWSFTRIPFESPLWEFIHEYHSRDFSKLSDKYTLVEYRNLEEEYLSQVRLVTKNWGKVEFVLLDSSLSKDLDLKFEMKQELDDVMDYKLHQIDSMPDLEIKK